MFILQLIYNTLMIKTPFVVDINRGFPFILLMFSKCPANMSGGCLDEISTAFIYLLNTSIEHPPAAPYKAYGQRKGIT